MWEENMYRWQVEAVGQPNPKTGEIPTKWYAVDEYDNAKLSTKAMQEGLTHDEAMSLWQRKHWSLLKEKYLAKEKMTFPEAKNINSYEDLVKWVGQKNTENKADPIQIAPEVSKPFIDVPEDAQHTSDIIKEHMNAPLDVKNANIPKQKRTGGTSKFSEKVGAAVADAMGAK